MPLLKSHSPSKRQKALPRSPSLLGRLRARLFQLSLFGLVGMAGLTQGVDAAGNSLSLEQISDTHANRIRAAIAPSPSVAYPKHLIANHGSPLPDARPAMADKGDIRTVWLTQPTDRYAHGVLGDAIEAGGVAVMLADGSTTSFSLPDDSVFEDLTPRLADLDGDGRNEIVLVRSYQNAGGALAVLGIKDGTLQILAEAPAIGRTNRWLNPSLVGSFDQSDKMTIGLVQTPHIGGQLQLWRYDNGRLKLLRKANGFSNHSIGSRALGLSALLSKGDHRRILIPDATQGNLLVLDAENLKPLGRIALPARPVADFAVSANQDGRQSVLLSLRNGKHYLLTDNAGHLFD